MKSVSIATAALALTGAAFAQPRPRHGHQHLHAKRELVTDWVTEWVTETVVVGDGTTSTLSPTGVPGEFFQPTSSESSSTSTSTSTSVPAVVTPSVQEVPPPAPAPSTSSTTSTVETQPTVQAPPPPAPTTTLMPVVVPTTTSTPVVVVPTTTSAEAPAATPSSSDSGSSGSSGSSGFTPLVPITGGSKITSFSGKMTYYDLGQGSCGYDDSGKDYSDNVVAVSADDWDNWGTEATSLGIDMPANPWCGMPITITAGNGKTINGVVRDKCPGCASGAIDVSKVIFETLYGSLDDGHNQVSWVVNL